MKMMFGMMKMKAVRIASLFLIAMAAFFTGCCHKHKDPFLHGIAFEGVTQRGPIEVYNRNTLFDYMNGEAEVYLPHGFTLLYTARYRKPGTDGVILVETYDMASPAGAREVYAEYTRKGGRTIEGIGSAAWTDSSILLFWRNRYFFRLGPDPTIQTDSIPQLNEIVEAAQVLDKVASQGSGP